MRFSGASARAYPQLLAAAVVAFRAAIATAGPAPIQTFYVPLPEEEIRAGFLALNPGLGDTTVRTTIAITIAGNGTLLYYDHWEDGYEADIANPVQPTSQIWGDGNLATGAPPGCGAPACDVLNAGRVIILQNDVFAAPRDPASLLFDGRDKFGSTLLVAVTQTGWPVTTGSVLADATEVFSTNDWGTVYEAPGGEGYSPMFGDARFVIMAQRAGTIIRVDIDDDGNDDIVQAIGEGETLVVDGVRVGTRVFANLPVQTTLLAGDPSATYEWRWYSMVPRNRWSDSYIAPVGTTVLATPAAVLLYNPQATPLNVNATTTGGTTALVVPAGGLTRFTMPVNSGALFQSTDGRAFFAIASIDDEGQAHDWGHTLLPASTLAPAVKVGWGVGSADPAAENSSPIWVTAASPTTLNIDWNDDGTVDQTVAIAQALQSVQLRDTSDNDQTGARIFTTDGTFIAAAWGQDPNGASPGLPAIDVGTAVLPAPDVSILKNSSLAQDANGNGLLDPGDTLLYTLFVLNTGVVDADDVTVTDTPDPYTTYAPGTTEIDLVAHPDDAPPETPYPFDGSGVDLGTLTPGQGVTITYELAVGDPLPSPEQQIINTAEVTYGTGVFVSSTHVDPVATPQFSITKVSDLSGPALPGDTVQYTVTIQNTSPFTQTGITVDDPLPAGTSYVAESTTAAGAAVQEVADLVNAASYANDDGDRSWSSNWTETGDDGSPSSGDVRIESDLGALRFVIQDDDNALTRSANLTGFPAATLSFIARRNGLENGEYVAVEVSSGGPFVEVARFSGPTNDAAYGSYAFDISSFISASTQIRFASPNGRMRNSDQLYFDDVRISSAPLATYRDEFASVSFGNNDGTLSWSGTWVEAGEGGGAAGPASGDVQVTTDQGSGRLWVSDSSNSATRQADLSGASSATLSFGYRRQGLDNNGEYVAVLVSSDGGASFTEIDRFAATTDAGYTRVQYDISAYAASNTQIRFESSGRTDNNEGVYFDDVQIAAPTSGAIVKTNQAVATFPLLDGDPPNLVLAGDNFTLAPGAILTATYRVVVDDPLNPFRPAIVNVVSVDSNESLTPTPATRLDPVAPGSLIGDRVWLDVDGDGVEDVGEVGLANVRVRLYRDPDGVPESGDEVVGNTVFTDGNGNYLFDRVYPPASGSLYVEVDATTLPAGLAASPGNNGGRSASLTVTGSDSFLDLDFGYTTPLGTAVVGDRVWSDADGDGVQDPGEIGIGGVTLNLVAPGADGLFGTGDDVVSATATAASDGTYLFVGVSPGAYRVDVTDLGSVLAGYFLTVGPQSSTDPTTSINLASGDVDVSRDFGYRNPSLFTVSDVVWDDENGDGVRDPGEAGIGSVTVSMRDSSGNLVGTAFTAADGTFSFVGLANGAHTIEITDTGGVLVSRGPTTPAATAGQLAVTVAGANVSGTSFGYESLGTIGELVWSDADGDGVRDASEPGIPGVTLSLVVAGLDGAFGTADDSVVSTATTAADGTYRFTSLGKAYYQVRVTDTGAVLTGYTQTGDPDPVFDGKGDVPLQTGATNLLMNFGYRNQSLADVSGSVFDDTDADGVQDGTETGLASVTLDFVAAGADGIFGTIDDVLLASTTSGASGDYAFVDVPAGSYQVVVTDTGGVLNGYTLTSGLDAMAVTVAGTDVTGVDFGYVHGVGTASIGHRVWLDANRDGVINPSEDGIGNVTLGLYTPGADGILGNGDDVLLATTTTDTAGYYRFDALPAGEYYVDLDGTTLPAGLATTVGSSDPTGRIQLADGQAYAGANFGYASASGSVLGDSVFFDADGDGFQDPGEPGIAGVSLTVTGPSGAFNVTTDAAGSWLVAALSPGSYVVTVDTATLPAGYNTTPTNGPASRSYPVSAGLDYLRADFGFDAPAGTTGSIGDRIWFDANGDGVQDGGETGVSGVTLRLLDASGNAVGSMTTGAGGAYDFLGLAPGDYRAEATDVFGALDGLNLSAGTNPSSVIALAAGDDRNDVDFGYAPSGGVGSIGGFVWQDVDGSGDVNGSESSLGIQGVTVDLYVDVNGNGVLDPGVDNLVRTTATDVIGEYQLNGLPAASYLVDVTDRGGVLTGFTKTTGAAGADDNSQADPYAIVLAAGATDFTADFGYQGAGTNVVSGTTFFDAVGNGVLDGTDSGVDGVTVYLYRDIDGDGDLDPGDTRIGQVISSSGGAYAFSNLPDGSFIVAVDVSGTYLQSSYQTTQLLTGGIQPVTLSGASSGGNHFGFNISATLVTLTSFEANEDAGRVVVEWTTGTEIGTLGFYVFRWQARQHRYVQVNDALLPALRAPSGGLYRVVDETAPTRGRLTYLLYEAEEGGGERRYGPFDVQVGATRTDRASLAGAAFERRARRQARALSDRIQKARERREAKRESLREARAARRRRLGNAAVLKLTVRERGLYFVSSSAIAAELSRHEAFVRALLAAGRLSLTSQGAPVAWSPAADLSGLYFYGEGLETMYASANVYWLAAGAGERVGALRGAPAGARPGPGYYVFSEHLEQDAFAATLASTDPDADFWYWSSLMATYPDYRTGRYAFEARDVEPAFGVPARIEAHVYGATATAHRIVALVNGVEVGQGTFQGVGVASFAFELEASLLGDGPNAVELEAALDPGVAFDVVYVDSLDVSYPRALRAVSGEASFAAAGTGTVDVEGFGQDDVVALDVTEPRTPKRVASAAIVNGAARLGVVEGRRYFVAAAASRRVPEIATVESLDSLETGGADYLVIAPDSLVEAAGELADYRAGQGLSTRVVSLDTIHDELGFGIPSPDNVRRFLAQVHDGWRPAPRFVVLVGKGTYDFKDALGQGDNLMPPLMAATPLGLYASDNRLADVDGDGLADFMIGRVPVLSDEELRGFVAKLRSFEGSGLGEALFVADNADAAGNFPANSDEVAALLPEDVHVHRVYLSQLPLAEARAAMFDRLARGVGYWNYVGHGGLDRFTTEGLLTTSDVPSLVTSTPPVLASLTCSVGRFEIPGWASLGESLVMSESGGAIAVWAPSGLSYDVQALLLNRALVEALYDGETQYLGEAVHAALERFSREGQLPFMLSIYNLIGDPATRLR